MDRELGLHAFIYGTASHNAANTNNLRFIGEGGSKVLNVTSLSFEMIEQKPLNISGPLNNLAILLNMTTHVQQNLV